jgi:hypothetical protein
MIWLALLFAILVMGAIGVAMSASPRATPQPERDRDSPEALVRRDPAQALARYGTPADAERLVAEGRGDELRGLGWTGEGDGT